MNHFMYFMYYFCVLFVNAKGSAAAVAAEPAAAERHESGLGRKK